MKLLIYIPTWNRYESLMKQLEILGSSNLKEQFIVMVSDNCSTQEEYLEVKNFCNSQSNFRYHRNSSNLSANPNILNGFLFCHMAEYLWILSDDDLVKTEAVERVIERLKEYNPDFLYIVHNLGRKVDFLDADQEWVVRHIKDGMGLISLVIHRTSYIQDSIRAGYENLMSCFPHLAIIFESTKGRTAGICRVTRDEIFQPHNPLPIANSIWYKNSFFGFTHLAANLEEKLQRSFLTSWWYKNWFRVPGEMTYSPIHFAVCRSLLFKHINYFAIQWLALISLRPLILLAFFLKFRFRNFKIRSYM